MSNIDWGCFLAAAAASSAPLLLLLLLLLMLLLGDRFKVEEAHNLQACGLNSLSPATLLLLAIPLRLQIISFASSSKAVAFARLSSNQDNPLVALGAVLAVSSHTVK